MTRLSITHPAVLFAVAALCGLALAIWLSSPGRTSTDLYFHDTYFVVAPSHLAIAVGLLFAFYAGVYGLFPKFFGRNLNISMGQLHFWLSLVALLATVISRLWVNRLTGSAADPGSLTAVYQSRQFLALALTIPIAVLIFLLAQAIFVFNLLRSLLKGSEP